MSRHRRGIIAYPIQSSTKKPADETASQHGNDENGRQSRGPILRFFTLLCRNVIRVDAHGAKTPANAEKRRFPSECHLTGEDGAGRFRSLSRQARRPPAFRLRQANGTGRRDAAGNATGKAEDHDRVRPGPLTFRAGRGAILVDRCFSFVSCERRGREPGWCSEGVVVGVLRVTRGMPAEGTAARPGH